ncbi:glycosyltransferase [bacterium]|nr:glycosyltransferase [bacterium]
MKPHNFSPDDSILDKRIAYISDHQFPVTRSDAEAEQVINTVASLTDEGVSIDLIIPKRWMNIGVSIDTRQKNLQKFYQVNGSFALTELLHLPMIPFRLEKFSHALFATSYSKLKKFDIVYTRHRASAWLALNLGLPVVFETYRLYDHWRPQVASQMARATHKKNLLGVITHSIPSKKSLVEIGADEKKIAIISNGFNPKHLLPRLSKAEARRELGWDPEAKIACYSGRLDKMKGIDTLLQLAQSTPEIRFYLIGKTVKDDPAWIEKAARRQYISNIVQVPWVALNALSRYLFAADVLLIPPTAQPMLRYRRTVLPIKTFVYLAAGVPILAPRLSDTAGVLDDQNAVLVEPDSLSSAKAALRRIFQNPAWAQSIAEQARLDSEGYTWQNRAWKIMEFLNERLSISQHAFQI